MATRRETVGYDKPIYDFPHCIDTKMFKDWKKPKKFDVLSVGTLLHKVTGHLREVFVKQLRDGPWRFKRASADRYARKYKGADFSRIINKSKITGTTNTLGQVLAKCMEITASRSLMFCNYSIDMEKFGFVDGESFVQWDEDNLYEKVKYYLDNPEEMKRITDNGYRVTHERHTTKVRAQEWLDIMKRHIHDY
jgi:spore maturation protein CgeB